jgi:hypothetical protein
MKLLLLLFFLMSLQQVDRWEIRRGKRSALKSSADKKLDTIRLSVSDTNSICIIYAEAESSIKWKRIFALKDKNDSLLISFPFQYSNGKFLLPAKDINYLLRKYGPLTLFTEQHPFSDEMMVRSKMQSLAILSGR